MAGEDIKLEKKSVARGELLDALATGDVVLTGNARLSRSLAADYERRMMAQGRVAWSTPAALPLDSWLRQAFEDTSLLADPQLPRLLSPEQEEQVWAAIIEEDGVPLLRIDATARRARDSWKLLCDWDLPLADRRFEDSESTTAFRRWAQRFESECRRRGLASVSDVPRLLLPLVSAGTCAAPGRLWLVGFYDLTPAQQKLADGFQAVGCDTHWVEFAGREAAAGRYRADDAQQEMACAVAWARRILESGTGGETSPRIGIVVPDLAERRPSLTNLLGKTLDPVSLAPGATPGGPLTARPWNLSLGRPLADYPVVATAIRLLSLMQSPVEVENLGVLLLSPHWALPRDPGERAEELDRRAMLDRQLRSLGDTRLPLSTLGWQARGLRGDGATQPWRCEDLSLRFDQLLDREHELPARATTGEWAARFSGWLKTAGWAGCADSGRPLDSHEYQAVETWNTLLSRFSSLEDFTGPLNRDAALALLGRLAAGTLFQPRASDAQVQVLGLYEAIGQSFDHLWVMGLHDGAWPAPARPDPFIPGGLQRETALPHSGPELELEWSRWVTGQLAAAAKEVVFSYPARDGNEELGCSPLIASFPPREISGLREPEEMRWQELVRASAAAETVPAPDAIPLRNPEVVGGSALFRNQAACPFKAFASHRLGAEPLDRVQAGLDPMRRGTVVHEVLERLWLELQSLAGLRALDETALRSMVRGRIDEVLEEQRRRSPATFTHRFTDVEARRLEGRVLDWLDIERQRSPFAVTGHERLQHFEIGGLRLRLKIDRVDELEDGARVVLDYKTGTVTPANWFGERPEDPQLPLYGVASLAEGPQAAPVAAVAFAQIKSDQLGFRGVVREAGILPGLPVNRKGELRDACDTWPAVLDSWAEELERLALAYREGNAAVDPKHGLKTCQDTYCELAPLCRVRESLPGSGAELPDEEGPLDG